MIDLEKQIGYWKTGGEEDWEAANRLLDAGMNRHGLFFAHLSLEKLIKGLVVKQTLEVPPKIHNLIRLLDLAQLQAEAAPPIVNALAKMNEFQMEGRYPAHSLPPPG